MTQPISPNLQRAAATVSDIIWRYVTTHTAEECEQLLRRVEEQRRIRQGRSCAPKSRQSA